MSLSGLTPQQATVGSATVLFFNDRITASKDQPVDYFVVVQPQAWQETPVEVHKGDRIEVEAAGNVAIDMWGINNYSLIRAKIDTLIEKRYRNTRDSDGDSPERHYDDLKLRNEIREQFSKVEDLAGAVGPKFDSYGPNESKPVERALIPLRGWSGPAGYAGEERDTAVGDRTNRKMLKNAKYGSLIGTFHRPKERCSFDDISRFVSRCVPARTDEKFVVGACLNPKLVDAPGWDDHESRKLWLIVNDVWDDKDPVFPQKFYIDNLGFFYARIRVIPAKAASKYVSSLDCSIR
jgi:hypothetical protein